jgi:fructose-1,6-bisphosphatase/inositol monophosphatase family enzyme
MLVETVSPAISFDLDRFLPRIEASILAAKNISWERITSQPEGQLALTFCQAVNNFFQPYFQDPYQLLVDNLHLKQEKPGTSPAYAFDHLAEMILFRILENSPFDITCFSEESGWQKNLGQKGKELKLVVDPFDESSFFAKRISEPNNKKYITQGAAITITDRQNNWLATALLDMPNERLVFGALDQEPKQIFLRQEGKKIVTLPLRLKKAYEQLLIMGFLDKPERKEKLEKTGIFEKLIVAPYPKTLGAWALTQLLTGQVDYLTDPHKGQPWYELAPFVLVRELGGIVKNTNTGKDIILDDLIKQGEENPATRFQFIAGINSEKLSRIIEILK